MLEVALPAVAAKEVVSEPDVASSEVRQPGVCQVAAEPPVAQPRLASSRSFEARSVARWQYDAPQGRAKFPWRNP